MNIMENKPNLQAILEEGFQDAGMQACVLFRKGSEMVLYDSNSDKIVHRYDLHKP